MTTMTYLSRAAEDQKTCVVCGRSRPATHYITASGDVCLACWMAGGDNDDALDVDAADFDAVMAALRQRAEIGLALGNGRNIDYPTGMDYQFARLLDSLRHWVVRVRVTLAADRYNLPEGGEIHEGHLRRFAGSDHQPWFSSCPVDDLALHRQIDDKQSVFGFCPREPFNTYTRIAKIEVIDPLLLGQYDPAVIWEATDDQRAGWALARQKSLARERFRAKCVIVHLSIIACVMVVSFVPALRAWWAGERWQTVGWAVAAFFISMFTWATIAFWEDGPDLGVFVVETHCPEMLAT